jgi:hypothetical protein
MTDSTELLASMQIYIERNGRPYNYLEPESVCLRNRKNYLTVRDAERLA